MNFIASNYHRFAENLIIIRATHFMSLRGIAKSGTPRDTVYPWGKGAHKQKIEHYCLQ